MQKCTDVCAGNILRARNKVSSLGGHLALALAVSTNWREYCILPLHTELHQNQYRASIYLYSLCFLECITILIISSIDVCIFCNLVSSSCSLANLLDYCDKLYVVEFKKMKLSRNFAADVPSSVIR